MLACTRQIGRMGSVAAGSTMSDFYPSEKEHGISVHATLLSTEWAGAKLNILGAPGYQDFVSEALCALRVGDSAVIVVNAGQGIAAARIKCGERRMNTTYQRRWLLPLWTRRIAILTPYWMMHGLILEPTYFR